MEGEGCLGEKGGCGEVGEEEGGKGGQREVRTRCPMIDKTSCGRGSVRDRR